MRPPNPQLTSRIHALNVSSNPYEAWLDHCATAHEYFELLAFLSSLPEIWVQSAERRVRAAQRRGIKVKNLLGYRLSGLWAGIIHLQEAKFVCDAVESAFRQNVLFRSRLARATCDRLAIPSWPTVAKRYEDAFRVPLMSSAALDSGVLAVLTFGQLLDLMKRNWYSLPPNTHGAVGLREMFAVTYRCRSLTAFTADMRVIKSHRDLIAHGRDLLDREQVQYLYRTACRWLTPLGVDLSDHIRRYRSKRPRFLRDLELE